MKRKIYLWGTGTRAVELNLYMKETIRSLNITGYIDNNKVGDFFGKKIFTPEVLREKNVEKVVVIINRFYTDITKQIEKDFRDCDVAVYDEIFLKKRQLQNRYAQTNNVEVKNVLQYLEKHTLSNFNGEFVEKYINYNVDIEWDNEHQMYYGWFENKKMYLSKNFDTKEAAKAYLVQIILEQDEKSPHRYLYEDFNVESNTIVIDAGVAEGNFSLSIIDKVSKIYMFEPNPDWVKALKLTFEPYKEKVSIINKSISDYCDDNTTTIDKIVSDYVDFIKMDVEGEEVYALKGSCKTIERSRNIRCAIAAYHQEFAYEAICMLMNEYNMKCRHTDGYMYYPDASFRAPVLRRGLVLAEKK